MTHIITNLCLRDNGCSDVCPVECIQPGKDSKWPAFYINPSACIDCGACVPECPFHAIFPSDELPAAFKAKGGEFINEAGLTGHYEATNHRGQKIVLETTRILATGEVLDLRGSIKTNELFFK
jgi:ferredoxin